MRTKKALQGALQGFAIHDTVRQGVIVVKKKPVTAKIRVKRDYSFPSNDPHGQYLAGFSSDEIRFSDTIIGIIPPQPVYVYDSSGRYVRPGTKSRKSKDRNDADNFNWDDYFSKMNYAFSRDDTVHSELRGREK